MKAFLKKVVFGYRSSQEAYVEYLKKCGVKSKKIRFIE